MIVGVGARPGVSAAEVLAAVDAVLPAVLPAGTDGVRLATLDARAAEPGLVQAAAARGWPLTGHPPAALAAVAVPSPSARVAAAVGTPSVAEAAALLGGGTLLVGRTVVGRVTVAVAVSGRGSEHRSEGGSRQGASLAAGSASGEGSDRGGHRGPGASSRAPRGSEPWTP